MRLRHCVAALSVSVALTGCSQMAVQMAKSNLGMNPVPPAFEGYKAPVANDPEAKEIVDILSVYDQNFDPVKGKSFEAEKKQEIIDDYKNLKDAFINSLLPAVSKVDAVKFYKDNLRTQQDTQYWYGNIQPAGSVDATVSSVDTINSAMQITTNTYGYSYNIDSIAEGQVKMAELDKIIRRAINSHVSDWTIRDKAVQDADFRSMIDSQTSMIKLSASRPDIVTKEQADGYRQKIKDYQKQINSPANYLSYAYNWESEFTMNLGGASMPKLNTLTILVMNRMSEQSMMGGKNINQQPMVTVNISSMIYLQ